MHPRHRWDIFWSVSFTHKARLLPEHKQPDKNLEERFMLVAEWGSPHTNAGSFSVYLDARIWWLGLFFVPQLKDMYRKPSMST